MPGGVLRAPAQVYLQSISFLQALVALFSLATSVLFRLLYRARQSFRRGVESRCIGFRNFIVCLHFFSSSSARDSVVFTFVKSSLSNGQFSGGGSINKNFLAKGNFDSGEELRPIDIVASDGRAVGFPFCRRHREFTAN